MDRPLANRIALVTGASRGIGYQAALALARRGAHIYATGRAVGGLEELDDAIKAEGGAATLVPLDMKDTAGIQRLADAMRERHGRLDILIGNAGLANVPSPIDHIEPKEWDDVMAVNVTANWHLIRFFDPLLRASDAGRVVFISSGAARNPRAYWTLYVTSKAALEMMARCYAEEAKSGTVRVNIFTPGQTQTQMIRKLYPSGDYESYNRPEDVVEQLVPLCLPSFTENGQIFRYAKPGV